MNRTIEILEKLKASCLETLNSFEKDLQEIDSNKEFHDGRHKGARHICLIIDRYILREQELERNKSINTDTDTDIDITTEIKRKPEPEPEPETEIEILNKFNKLFLFDFSETVEVGADCTWTVDSQ